MTTASEVTSEPNQAEAALGPAQKKAQAKFNDEIKSNSAQLDERFGRKLEVHADFSTFKEADWASQSVSSRGNEVLRGIYQLSDDVDYRPELIKHLKEVRFSFDGTPGPALQSITFKDGTLSFSAHKTHNNLLDVTYKVLKTALG